MVSTRVALPHIASPHCASVRTHSCRVLPAQSLAGAESVDWTMIAIGTLLSGITGYLCIKLFLKVIQQIGMLPFVIYRMLLGALLIYLIWQ